MEKSAGTKDDLYSAFQSIENQSYSCGPDEIVNPEKVYIRLSEENLLKDDDGDTLVQLSSVTEPLRKALFEVLDVTQGVQGDVQLSIENGAGFVTFSDGNKQLASKDPKILALMQWLIKS